MKIGQALKYHSTVCLDGLGSGGEWVPCVAKGIFQVYDRFISARDFGLVKRTFLTAHNTLGAGKYLTVRLTQTGGVYIVQAENQDIGGAISEVYGHVYLLQEATSVVQILSEVAGVAASGMPTDGWEVTDDAVWGYLSRLSGRDEDPLDLAMTSSVLTMPGNTKITTDNVLDIDGMYYDVVEVWGSILTIQAKVTRRSSGV